jgi:uncharacterized protein (DUF1684 family)
MKTVLFFIAALLLFTFCGQHNSETRQFTREQADSLEKAFDNYLSERNREFKEELWSPLPAEEKKNFQGLNYYPYDVSWHFEGGLELLSDPDTVIIYGTKGEERKCFNYGYFHFSKEGKDYKLLILKFPPFRKGAKSYLFLGFWDKTSGDETYGGGRYIDIEENSDNYYVVDFNYAFNPYCAYNHRYTCAVPPLENRLPLSIRAGEKKFKEH